MHYVLLQKSGCARLNGRLTRMMSTEFPEILPELPFSNPHASFGGNAENFISEVVHSCHSSLYNSSNAYYSDNSNCAHSFDAESSHHSLILEDPLESPDRKNSNGRSSYSCEPNVQVGSNCIKLIMKEASDCSHESSGGYPFLHFDGEGHGDMDRVQVTVDCADKESSSNIVSRSVALGHDLLRPNLSSPVPSCDSCGSPTPTPSYGDLVPSPSIEYPGAEEKAFALRGGEEAQWEETSVKTDEVVLPSSSHTVQVEGVPDCFGNPCSNDVEERILLSDTISHKSVNHNLPKRRSYLSHLKSVQSPHVLSLPTAELRKLSDPAIHIRRQKLKTSFEPKQQRCLSDTEAPFFPFHMDEDELKSEEGCSSALGCDSGFHDERIPKFHDIPSSSPRVSLYSSDFHSQDDNSEQQRSRRVAPHPFANPFVDNSQSDDQSSTPASNPGTMVHPRERSRRSLLKNYSQGSIGGVSVGGGSISSMGASSESPSLSSVLESQSNMTCATDILSSLGFDDFDSPQLVPDRFIPKDLEYLRPSSMKAAFIEQTFSQDHPRSPDSLTSGNSSNYIAPPAPQRSVVEVSDLALGATAENFMPDLASISITASTPAEADLPHAPSSPSDATPLFTDTLAITGFTRSHVLETVPEETASDLSLSPRWLSPRVSIDHSVLDLAEGKLGASLQKVRRRSLPSREGYKLSIGSLVESDTGDSIHLSVTSYDDEVAAEREREREREGMIAGLGDDITVGAGRRRRRGVYTPPQTLLSWLSTQKTIDEEVDTDPDELPWPFNEQARLRKSLTEISLAQQVSLSDADDNLNVTDSNSQREMSLSPISSPNIRSSPVPTLSDGEFDDLEEALEISHSHIDEIPYRDHHLYQHSNLGGGHHMLSPTRVRHHEAPISPLTLNSCRLSPGDGVLWPLHMSEARPPIPGSPEDDTNSLTLPGHNNASECITPTPTLQQHYIMPPLTCEAPGSTDVDVQERDKNAVSEAPPTMSNHRRRPRLCTQSSIESQTSLPEDMSEIELLTGDLHTPVISKAPFKKQKSLEEMPQQQTPSRSRLSRRVAMIGEAPTAAELFATTTITENKSQLGKYIVL